MRKVHKIDTRALCIMQNNKKKFNFIIKGGKKMPLKWLLYVAEYGCFPRNAEEYEHMQVQEQPKSIDKEKKTELKQQKEKQEDD